MSTDESDKTRALIVVGAVLLVCGCCLIGGPLFGGFVAVGNQLSNGESDYRSQCEAALGPDPSATVTQTTTPAEPESEPESSPSPQPSVNPYRELEFDPDDPNVTDRDRACASAMKYAPRQPLGAIRQPNTGTAVACAQQLGLRYAENGTGDAAAMARDLIYAASAAALNGQCDILRAPAGADTAPSECGNPTEPLQVVVLPQTVERQGYCGQRVAASAISPGDLVFWEYGREGATRVGVAIGVREMVTGEPGGDRFVRLPIPERRDVLVKRVLGGGR